MRTIYKQKLKLVTEQRLYTQGAGKLLAVQIQDESAVVWYEADTEAKLVKRKIYCFGTGYPLPTDISLTYIDTIQDAGFVWHFYESL